AAGLALMAEEKFSEALGKLEEAQRLDPGIGTEFNIALCDEQLGRLTEAWRHYSNVERLAHAAGKAQREETARQKLATLKPRISAFAITSAKDVTVRVDGSVIAADDQSFVLVGAGEHQIDAESAGKQPWTLTLSTTAPGETQPVTIPALAAIEAPKPPRVVTVTRETTNTRRTVGIVVGGVGVLSAAAFTVTGIMMANDHSG